ncbi:MAG: hypothetical protein JJE13_05745 [Thermoleophilia bacterium]|nr:hypothetical protein [Thermoleophilia bacterium]
MNPTLKFTSGLLAAALIALVGATSAQAANESATNDFSMVPQSGTFYKDAPRPANWRVEVEITAPFPQNPEVLPLKEVRADFPDEMSFNPDPKMPVCPDNEVGPPPVNMTVPPDTIVARCPKSVIGNGKSYLYLNRTNGPTGPNLKDAVLIVFNGGRNAAGLPKIKIYGYSKGVNTGIYMEGVLKNGKLEVAIPVLAYDSSVGYFDLNIPGTNDPVANRRGLDKSYVRTTCAHSPWTGGSEFTLGTRNDDGSPISPDSIVKPPPLSVPCTGATGSAKFSKVKIKGPSKVKQGGKGTFKVSMTNSGTATAKGLTVSASGRGAKGKAKAGTLAPGKSKTVKVKVKFTKSGSSKVKFKAGAKGARAGSATKKVKVS